MYFLRFSFQAPLLLAICAAPLLAAAPLRAAPATLTVTKAARGVGGHAKSRFWTPLRVTVKAGDGPVTGRLEAVIPDGDRVPAVYASERSLDLSPGEETELIWYIKTGPVAARIRLQLRQGDSAPWSQDITGLVSTPLPPTDRLYVGIGPDAGLVTAIGALKQGDRLAHAVQLRSAEELPDRWWGYDGVDAIVLTTSDGEWLEKISQAQRQALIEWVRQQGRLVLCVGARGSEVFQAGSEWADLRPGELVEVSPLRQGSGLEGISGTELPFDQQPFLRDRPQVARFREPRGPVLVDEGGAGGVDRPLIIRFSLSFGEVVFVGLDLDHAALSAWPGRNRMLTVLVTEAFDQRAPRAADRRASVTHLGYTDLTGQLRAALDQFEGVTMVNFTTVSILTLIFLLLIGPGDYFFLSRVGWQRHWTWLSFPLLALAFAAVAWILGGQSHGRLVRVNQAEIVDFDLESGRVRGIAWAHLYSPTTRTFGLSAAIKPPSPGSGLAGWLAWQGLPGDALGGLESNQIVLASAAPYRIDPPSPRPHIEHLPVQVGASKALQVRWWGETALEGSTRLALGSSGLLEGEFIQPLPVELSDCLLIHGERLYRLGKLRAGQRVYVADLAPLNLEARLTEVQRSGGGEAKLEPTAWRQDSTDISRILRMLMFHDAARGSSYTGLTHHYESPVELTRQVRLGRAILVGKAETAVVTLHDGGAPAAAADASHHWTWCRILMPVASEPLPANQP